MRDEHFGDAEVHYRTAVARLWWPGYLSLGEPDYATVVAEDGCHMWQAHGEESYVQVNGEYILAWDYDLIKDS